MLILKDIIRNIICGALILIPIIIFIHFTYHHFSIYSPIPSIYYFFASMEMGPLYLMLNFYITGILAKFFSQNLNYNL